MKKERRKRKKTCTQRFVFVLGSIEFELVEEYLIYMKNRDIYELSEWRKLRKKEKKVKINIFIKLEIIEEDKVNICLVCLHRITTSCALEEKKQNF